MKFAELRAREYFNREDLVFFAYGNLVEDPPENFAARLPAPPFLMLDRVLSFKENGKQGSILAEQDVRMNAWYFQCHMPGDPVQPGCFCVEAFWQLLGFYCVWQGFRIRQGIRVRRGVPKRADPSFQPGCTIRDRRETLFSFTGLGCRYCHRRWTGICG